MERFREQEKVFKMKEYSIKGLQQTKSGKNLEEFESGDEDPSKEEDYSYQIA